MHRLRLALLATLFVVVGCRASGSDPGPAAGLDGPPPGTAAASTMEHDVEVAYLRSWDVYAKAALTLSPVGLEECFANEALELARYDVDRLTRAGTPGRFQVDHQLTVSLIGREEARVVDTYVNHSVALDASTHQPIEPDPNQTVSQTYTLRRNGHTWLVTDISRS
jgi:hypothetical protein